MYINKRAWVRMVEGRVSDRALMVRMVERRVSDRALMYYVLLPKRMLDNNEYHLRYIYSNVCRGESGAMSDQSQINKYFLNYIFC